MQSLLKILAVIVELIGWAVRVKQQEKHDDEVKSVRRDPVGSFRSEFGGVPDNEAGQPEGLHSSKASAQVDTRQ